MNQQILVEALQELVEAMEFITYQERGHTITAIHAEVDCTDIVGAALLNAKTVLAQV